MPPSEAEPLGRSNKYRRVAAVGQGGMADVWLVVARGPAGFNKLLALKELKSPLCGDPEFTAMFLDEARIAARLNHPNVVQTYEVGLEGERPGLVMEWLEGQPLHVLLGPGARASVSLAAQVFVLAKVLDALEYAHELRDFDGTPLGLVHRDVSPHNVFVTYDGRVKLMDFGIAKLAGSDACTQVGVVKGKVGYVAPEQIAGGRLDRRADLFAVGVMLWEALAGRRLSAGDARGVVFAKRLEGVYEPVLSVAPDAPRALAAAVDRAMALSPGDRYPSAAAMRAELEAWLAGERVSERELGELVSAVFADERRHVRKLIEQQMCALRDERPSAPGRLRVVALAPRGEASARGASPSHDRSPPPPPVALRPPDAGANGALAMAAATPTGPAPTSTPGSARSPAAPRPARPSLAVVASAALALGALALAFAAPRQAPAGAGPEVMALVATPAAPPGALAANAPAANALAANAPAANAPTEIELSVQTRPPGARVYLDGEAAGQSPLTLRVPRDGRDRGGHRLRVSAPGFRDEERAVVFSRDDAVELALRPLGGPARGAPKAPSTEPEAAPERLQGSTPGARPVEGSNPYGMRRR